METSSGARQHASGMMTTPADVSEEVQRAIASDDVAALGVALVGYGEVGGIFGAALAAAGVGRVIAFDVLIEDAMWAAKARARGTRDGVTLAAGTGEAVADCALVISAVTAAQTASAAAQIASACRRGTFVLDVNSASPRTKTACAE